MKKTKTIKNIIYIAGVIADKKDLLAFFSPDDYPNVYCDHMTIKYGDIDELPKNIGKKFNFIVNVIAFNEKAIAVAGEPDNDDIKNLMKSIGQFPHITLCTVEGVKPVYSNELLKTGYCEKIDQLVIPMKVGAFVAYDDDTTGWVFTKRRNTKK